MAPVVGGIGDDDGAGRVELAGDDDGAGGVELTDAAGVGGVVPVGAGRLTANQQITMGKRTGRPTLTGIGWRIRGLALAARGELPSAATALDHAVHAHSQSPLPLELARSHLALGQLHRRLRDTATARTNLEAAAQQFTSLGATAWTELAQTDLVRLGARRATTQLTPTETRVAVLAGRGHNNREIATELFLSTRTVEGHLAATYRKLQVRGRADLARHPGIEE